MNGQCMITATTKQAPDAQSKQGQLVSLSHLLSREVQSEKIPKPVIRCGCTAQQKKGEDFALINIDSQRIPGDCSTSFAVFAVFDGHNGTAAASYAKTHLLKDVMTLIPNSLSRDEWLALLPKALVAGFIKTDQEFKKRKQSSGTTATLVVVDGWTVTVASVGDSCCILDSQCGAISTLTVSHRLEENVEERNRVSSSGGKVCRLRLVDGNEIGPLRCWPGGLCLSRSIGDVDVGEFVVPIPYVEQVQLSSAGGRLIIASDGVWNVVKCERAAKCCRGLPAELAARQVVKEALQVRGIMDDTTCIVADIMPPKLPGPVSPVIQRKSKLSSLFFWKRSAQQRNTPARPMVIQVAEEVFTEDSPFLAERLETDPPEQSVSEIFYCADCKLDITPREGISVHAGLLFSTSKNLWEGPFLCALCKFKQGDGACKDQQAIL